MSLSFTDLKFKRPVLEPVPVEISGLVEPLLIHQFTVGQMGDVLRAKNEGSDAEKAVRNEVLKFLNGPDYEPTEEDRVALVNIFTSYQVREIYTKALKLNGYGPDALREAEKN